MFWPVSLDTVQRLPETADLELLYKRAHKDGPEVTYEPSPHLDPIIGSVTSPGVKTHKSACPYAVLTYRSVYLFDSHSGAPVSAHIRSNDSIAKFGANVKVKVSPNGRNFAVETSGNVVLVYTTRVESDEELLTLFDAEGIVLQNGTPIPRYRSGTNALNGTQLSSKDAKGFMQNVLTVLLGKGGVENPVYDHSLRLRLILNVQSRLSDFCFLDDTELLLVNSKPRAFQVVKLDGPKDEQIKYLLMDDLKWYPENDSAVGIDEMHYDFVLNCFVWVNELGRCWLVKRDPTQLLSLKGAVIYSGKVRAIKSVISHRKNLCYVALEDGTLLIYQMHTDLTASLLKTIQSPLSAAKLCRLALSPHGESLVVQYVNGWSVYSFLGNLNFSTFEYDPLVFSTPGDIRFIDALHLLLATDKNLIRISLGSLNYSHNLTSAAVKRPVIIDSDKLWIFKAYDKKLVDQHHYNYNVNDTTGKETNIWLVESLPLEFRMRNDGVIRSCTANDDGTKVCVVGARDVVIFDTRSNTWRYLDLAIAGTDDEEDTRTSSYVVACTWWKDYLIVCLRAPKKSALLAFPPMTFQNDQAFNDGTAVWTFDSTETKDNESFLNINVDLFRDELMVTTDRLNIYTWKLYLKESIRIERSRVYQLEKCFGKQSEIIRDNYRTVVAVGEADLLLLSGTEVFYLRRVRGTETSAFYEARCLTPLAEYVQKLTSALVCIFDGSQLLHYNVSRGQDLAMISPIKVKVGNDIVSDRPGEYRVNSTGTTPYPLTTMSSKNIVFGMEADCPSNTKIRLETTKRNYLDDLVNHYIESNIRAYAEDPNALGISVVYRKLHRFKEFKFVLELLLMRYIQHSYEDGEFDKNREYFDRLMELIRLTGHEYEIVLKCLRKTEAQYWPVLFSNLDKTPRSIVNELIEEAEDYQLAAHYFTVMLNYEKDQQLGKDDLELVGNVLRMLVRTRNYETAFELLRFIKLIDDDKCHSIIEKLGQMTLE